jgi:hypothetical protein
MDQEHAQQTDDKSEEMRQLIRQTLEEFIRTQQQRSEPSYKTELVEERKRRETLEQRLNQLVEENRQARSAAEEAERYSQIRSELQKLGVAKVDLAFRAVKDDIVRAEDGRLVAKNQDGKRFEDFLQGFVQENPELLPARIAGGAGTPNSVREGGPGTGTGIDLDKIKAGMNPEELERVRQEIARIATRSLRGA